MTDEILEFIVMVNGGDSESEVLRAITERIPEAAEIEKDSCELRGNRLEVWANEDADPSRATDEEEGYLYFRWRIEVLPQRDDVGEEAQVGLAGEMLGALREDRGWDATLAATFEDRVEEGRAEEGEEGSAE
ncbi:hypothetical protein [Halostreptopolyspora alba]|uniref:Uncharacterized protein n=1 Tax=Halostreptopolyspora alba TaxID=2487137 RepID=A0A3N0EDD1_9ACTN|nr:hypothetical protein EFW17_07810 [Nocardiopsaceae bacterium YIM 96095]